MAEIRIGVIGVGGISQYHIEGIQRSPGAELVALCDIDKAVLSQAGDRYAIEEKYRFANHAELLDCAEVDAVSICTPNDSHFTIAMEAIRQRKPFALEKPVTMNAHEAMVLCDAAEQAGLPHMVCFSYRFKKAARYARWLILQGALGKIHHIYGQYLQSWAIDENLQRIWRFDKKISGSGALADLGSHMLDLVRFIAGDFTKICGSTGTFITERKLPSSSDTAPVDVDDYCHFMAGLEGGVSAAFEISRFAYGRGNYQRIEVYGSKGAMVYNLEDDDCIEICTDAVAGHAAKYNHVPIPEEFKSDQIQSFLDIMNGRGDGLAADLSDGAINQKLIDAILASSAGSRWVEMDKGELQG